METADPSASPANPVPSEAEDEISLSALNQAYRSLRAQFFALLLTLVVLDGSLNIYLLRQVSLVRRDVEAGQRVVADYIRTGEPMIKSFVGQLDAFSKTHPDFRPILARYVNSSNAPAVPLPPKAAPGR